MFFLDVHLQLCSCHRMFLLVFAVWLVSSSSAVPRVSSKENAVLDGNYFESDSETLTATVPEDQLWLDDDYMDPEQPDETLAPVPYKFEYNHKDIFGTMQHREENKGEDGVVRGSYGYRDPNGMYRHVSYIADSGGFHAVLRTNEPGIGNRNSADVAVVAQVPKYSSYSNSRNNGGRSQNRRR